MRRILIENARRRRRLRHGGAAGRRDLALDGLPALADPDEVLAVDEALDRLAATDPDAARLVQLRYFAGLTMPEAAAVMGLSLRSAERLWTFARAWLRRAIEAR
jgi:RNA polymerase sigma factor (TIGR02999 family)